MLSTALSLAALSIALQAEGRPRLAPAPALLERGIGLRPVAQQAEPLPGDEVLRGRSLSPEAEAALAELGAPEFERRQAASERLRGDTIPIDELLAALARTTLSDEQRNRLVTIAIDRIVNAPRGALGIRMDIVRNPGLVAGAVGGVRVTGLVDGMPAARHLEVDDVIVAINGRALRDRDDLVTVVQGLAPGTIVRVEAIRAERDDRGKPRLDAAGQPVTRRIDAVFPLGSTRDLEQDGDRQGAMVANPVTGQRLELARAVAQRFGPLPRIVAVPEDRLAAERLAQQSPDIHPDVQSLLRWRELVKLQGGVWDETTLELLRGTLAELRRRAADPSLTAAERDWFSRVADRYAELIPPGDEP
jgi:hypothetical protein